jgi:hypothetical protein
MFFKPYQRATYETLWKHPDGLSSREISVMVNNMLPYSISRASIIHFLNRSFENGIVNYREETCKGGVRRIYRHKYDKQGLIDYLTSLVKQALTTLK